MSRIVPAEELDLIERVISEHPEGLGISALEIALATHLPHINRRTLQRRLKRLQKGRRIITEGESIALVYKPAPTVITPHPAVHKIASDSVRVESYVPVSPEGGIIRSQPARHPIGKPAP